MYYHIAKFCLNMCVCVCVYLGDNAGYGAISSCLCLGGHLDMLLSFMFGSSGGQQRGEIYIL